jgi:hypothetical protein
MVRATLTLSVLVLCAGPVAAGELPPRRRAALVRWLEDAPYRATWVAEPAAHPSAGAHGGSVRTWYSPVLVEDLAGGASTFRRNAAMVKELYGGDGAVVAWAVMRKVARRSGPNGRGWLFFEGTAARGGFFGRGVPLCARCHAEGTDFLRSEFRP